MSEDEDRTAASQDDWPFPGFLHPARPPDDIPPGMLLDHGIEVSPAYNHQDKYASSYRRKPRIIWFVSGQYGLVADDTWEKLIYEEASLAHFVDRYRTAYYDVASALGDTRGSDFYYLRQGDIVVGRARSSSCVSEDDPDIDVVAVIGEVERNTRGKMQEPVPGATFIFSHNMTHDGTKHQQDHTFTFITPFEQCYQCGDTSDPYEEICDPYEAGPEEGVTGPFCDDDGLCGLNFCVVTDVVPATGYYCCCGAFDGEGECPECLCLMNSLSVTHRELFFDKCGRLMEVGPTVTRTMEPSCEGYAC